MAVAEKYFFVSETCLFGLITVSELAIRIWPHFRILPSFQKNVRKRKAGATLRGQSPAVY